MNQWQQQGSLLNLTAEIHGREERSRFDTEAKEMLCFGTGTIYRVDSETVWVRIAQSGASSPTVGRPVDVHLFDGDEQRGTFSSRIIVHRLEDDESHVLGLQYPNHLASSDMRRQPRAETKIPARFFHMATKGTLLPFRERRLEHPAVIRDLNETGAQILSDTEFPHEARLVLNFTFRGIKFEEAGDIVWSQSAGERFLYGLRFNQLNIVIQDILRTQPLPRR